MAGKHRFRLRVRAVREGVRSGRRLAVIGATVVAVGAVGAGMAMASTHGPENKPEVAAVYASGVADTGYTTQPWAPTPQGYAWADDTFLVTFTLTRTSVPASDCGNASGPCYSYTGTAYFDGSFTSLPGANSPNTPVVPIKGVVSGSLTGTESQAFYATSSDLRNGRPIHAAGQYITQEQFIAALFPAGTGITLAPTQAASYSFTYRDADCEQLVENTTTDDAAGLGGNITGVNACPVRHHHGR